MGRILRTLYGVLIGWLVSGVVAALGRLQHQQTARTTQRRTFVRNAALGAVGAVGAATTLVVGTLVWPNKTGAFGKDLTITADNVPPVNGAPFRHIQGKFYLVHNDDGLMALWTKCPHLGCAVPYIGPPESDKAFQCPCHGSMYDFNGVRTGGPAPRPMDRFPVTIDGDNVVVSTGVAKAITRESYDPSQATPYPI